MLKSAVPLTRASRKVLLPRRLATARSNLVVPQSREPILVRSAETKVGVYIDAGSRFETAENNGVAHFLEHMAFKGTKKRAQLALELETEQMGAHLNAYTSREHTIYYAKCLDTDLEKGVEILSDILLNSVYGKQEVEREKGVIVRESEEIDQIMQEVVFDRLHAIAYKSCSLGRPILGSIKNIKAMRREDLVEYVQTYYKGPRMVLAAAGGVDHDHLVSLAEKYFGCIQRGSDKVLDYEPGVFSESWEVDVHDDMELVYGCLAVEGTPWTHPLNLAMQLTGSFDRTLGTGLVAPSALAQDMARRGTVENFLSFATNYKDTGLTGVYFACDPDGLRDILQGICEQWRGFSQHVDEAVLDRAKKTLFNNMVVMLDGTTPICEDIGRQLLCYDRHMTTPELKARMDAIDVPTMQEMFRTYYLNRPLSLSVVGPAKQCPSFEEVKSWLTV